MERVPADVLVVVILATPEELSPTEPRDVVPSLKVTDPTGITPVAEVTEAEYVTDCPYVEGFSVEVTAGVVVAS